jgi:hypothetical protein
MKREKRKKLVKTLSLASQGKQENCRAIYMYPHRKDETSGWVSLQYDMYLIQREGGSVPTYTPR